MNSPKTIRIEPGSRPLPRRTMRAGVALLGAVALVLTIAISGYVGIIYLVNSHTHQNW